MAAEASCAEKKPLERCIVRKMPTTGGSFGPAFYYTLVDDGAGKLYKVEINVEDEELWEGNPEEMTDRMSIEVYDEEQGKWSAVIAKNKWEGTPVFYYTTTYYNNSIYLFGGIDLCMNGSPSNDLWRFDLESCMWTLIKIKSDRKPMSRLFHSYFLINSMLVIYGGNKILSVALDDMWVIDLREAEKGEASWRILHYRGAFPRGQVTHTSYHSVDDRLVWVVDLSTHNLWSFDIDNFIWTKSSFSVNKLEFTNIRTFGIDGFGKKLLIYGTTTDGFRVITVDTRTMESSKLRFLDKESKKAARTIKAPGFLMSTRFGNRIVMAPLTKWKTSLLFTLELATDTSVKDSAAVTLPDAGEQENGAAGSSLPFDRSSNHMCHVFLAAAHDTFTK